MSLQQQQPALQAHKRNVTHKRNQ